MSLHGVRVCMSVHVSACLSELVVERVRGRVRVGLEKLNATIVGWAIGW